MATTSKLPQWMVQLPQWMVYWLYTTIVIVIIDATFIIMRPHSFADGYLGWFFFPYKAYYEVDGLYGDVKDSFVYAQSLCNYVEVIICIYVLYSHYQRSRTTKLLALVVSIMTFWKTILYLTVYYNMDFRRNNTVVQEICIVFFPSGFWIVFPAMSIYVLFNDIVCQFENTEAHTTVYDVQAYNIVKSGDIPIMNFPETTLKQRHTDT